MITPDDIASMTYVDLISLLRETNRCPGGKQTIREILINSFTDSSAQVLEIGSNTGFTSLEIARTARCRVVGIDSVESAVKESTRLLREDHPEIQNRVEFKLASAYDLPFENESFDLVVAGGATSFMQCKEKALSEYYRVLKPWRFLSVTHLCYFTSPPADVVANVSSVIGVPIDVRDAEQWLQYVEAATPFERYYARSQFLGSQSINRIKDHVEMFLKKPHLSDVSRETREAIRKRWTEILSIFNENHKYLGYVLVLYRKRQVPEEPELFLPTRHLWSAET